MLLIQSHCELKVILLFSYRIIKKCWKQDPNERPTFVDLVAMLDIRLQEVAGYLEMEMVLVPKGEDKKSLINGKL